MSCRVSFLVPLALSLLTSPAADIAGYWNLQEGNGQIAGDALGRQNGVLGWSEQSEPEDPRWLTADGNGGPGGLTFSGRQFVRIPHHKAFETPRSFTIETQVLMSSFNPGTLVRINGQFALDLHADGSRLTVRFAIWPKEQGDTPIIVTAPAKLLEASQWQRIAGVLDCENRALILYINGQEAARADTTSQGTSINPLTPLVLGAQLSDKDKQLAKPYTGAMANVRLSSTALSADELLKIQ